jgi:hypothetical protein
VSAWEELQTVLGLIDAETKWLKRLNTTIDERKKQNYIEHRNLPVLISHFEVSSLQNTYKLLRLQF